MKEDTHLQERVACDNLQEPLESFPPGLDDLVGEAIGKDFSWQRGDVHPRRLSLEDVAKVLKVRVAPSHGRVAHPKGRDVCLSGPFGVSKCINNSKATYLTLVTIS